MKCVNSIIIVGGGTAGWLSALYLQLQLGKFSPLKKITVFDSSDIGIVGVGEATVHTIRYFLQELKISEAEFMQATDATYKLGIKFDDWCKPFDDLPHTYWHPFDGQNASFQGFDVGEIWNYASLNGNDISYDSTVSISPTLANHGRGPKLAMSKDFESPIPYAYHFDAGKAAQYFKSIALARGAKHINSTIDDVTVDEHGICGVSTGSDNHSADFYLDCSGFSRLLISKLDKGNWVSYEQELPCSNAVAIQTAYMPDEKPNVYTTSTALSNGWCWQIHLNSRKGNGYVYDNSFLNPEEAEQELREFLKIGSDVPAKHLSMQVGKNKRSWIGNCVAIGLSSGFIEPLESTGIYLIEAGLRRLMEFGLTSKPDLSVQTSYNQFMSDLYDDLKNFIVLHYGLSNRDDSEFWSSRKGVMEMNPKLMHHVKLASKKMLNDRDLALKSDLFNQINYRYVLIGMGFKPEQFHPSLQGLEVKQAQALLGELSQFYQNQVHNHVK